MAPKLHVVITSTRPNRAGPKLATWFHGVAKEQGSFDAELVDLATFNLPVFDEPKHPRLRQYEHEHTKAWSRSVEAADAFVFVLPEYNYNPPPSFVNAINYLVAEWAYKPVSFVSYGGVSGGLRSVQSAKLLVTTLKMMPIPEGVVVPGFGQLIDAEGKFNPTDINVQAAGETLKELRRWTDAMKTLRG